MSERADQPVASHNHGMPGQALAAQREAMGWTVEQVADQLKMAVRQVVALEAGDYASLPGPAVVRGFVRAYAKVVKLDAAPLVAMIALETPAPNDATGKTVTRSKPASFSQVRYPSNGKKRARSSLALVGAFVLVLAAAGVGAWQYGLVPAALLGGSSEPANAPAAAAGQASVTVLPAPIVGAGVPPIDTSVKPVEELKPVITNAVPLISVPPVAGAGAATGSGVAGAAGVAPAMPASASPAAPATPALTAPSAVNALVLKVREDTWIEVRPAKGPAQFKRMVKGGCVETIDVKEPVTLIVGKPSAVEATLRGSAVALPPVPGSTISRVSLQ